MEFKTGEITAKGHGLLSKVLAGAELKLVAAYCGDGDFDGDIWELEELVSPKLEGAIISVNPNPQERRTAVVVRFTNETVKRFFMLKEVGIYALDPEEGPVLYAYANYGERANFIEEYGGQWYTEDEITFYIYTANATNIKADIVKSSAAQEIGYENGITKLQSTDVQSAIDELSFDISGFYKLFRLKPLESADYGSKYFSHMPVDGGRFTDDFGDSMVIDGEDFKTPYTSNKTIDAGGFDDEYFMDIPGSGSEASVAVNVIDGGIF